MEATSEQLTTKDLEYNALARVREVVIEHGSELELAFKNKSKDKFYRIAEKAGFKPKEVPIGTGFINISGKQDMVTRYNPASMGKGNILYVAMEDGKLVSLEGLAHDVAAILLGEMRPHPDWSSTVSIPTFNDVAGRWGTKVYTPQELNQMKTLMFDKERRPVIAATRLLDAIVFDKNIPYGAVKYA